MNKRNVIRLSVIPSVLSIESVLMLLVSDLIIVRKVMMIQIGMIVICVSLVQLQASTFISTTIQWVI